MARAAGVLEHLVFMYADYIAAKSNADDDLRGALPL
jgi:hypothetical protein